MNEKWGNVVIAGTISVMGFTPIAGFVEHPKDTDTKYCAIYAPSENTNDLYEVFFQQPQVSSGTATTNIVLNI